MSEIERLSPSDVHAKVESGEALLVCAYRDDDKCELDRLSGAMTLDGLAAEQPLPSDKLLVFYCR